MCRQGIFDLGQRPGCLHGRDGASDNVTSGFRERLDLLYGCLHIFCFGIRHGLDQNRISASDDPVADFHNSCICSAHCLSSIYFLRDLRESYIAAAVPEGHPLEGKENITLKEAAKYPQVMFSRTSGFRSLQEQIFAEQGIQVKPVCEAEEIEVITGLVENGFGISILPYMDIVRLHHITAIPVQTSSWKSKFYIARRKYGIRTAQEEAFFQHWRK